MDGTWILHIKIIEAKAFRAFIRTYSLFKRQRLSANIKRTLHKALSSTVGSLYQQQINTTLLTYRNC
jgi:hypothetical protein